MMSALRTIIVSKRKEGDGRGTCATRNVSVSGVLEDRAPAQEAEPTARARDSPRHDGSAAAGSHSALAY